MSPLRRASFRTGSEPWQRFRQCGYQRCIKRFTPGVRSGIRKRRRARRGAIKHRRLFLRDPKRADREGDQLAAGRGPCRSMDEQGHPRRRQYRGIADRYRRDRPRCIGCRKSNDAIADQLLQRCTQGRWRCDNDALHADLRNIPPDQWRTGRTGLPRRHRRCDQWQGDARRTRAPARNRTAILTHSEQLLGNLWMAHTGTSTAKSKRRSESSDCSRS